MAGATFTFERPSPAVINGVFVACSQAIYKHDSVTPAAAFHELVKVVFLKMRADRELHRRHGERLQKGQPIPADEVTFSAAALAAREAADPHPLGAEFRALTARLPGGGLFDAGESIALQPGTARAVVALLERYDLFGVDEDLNGHLFEAFLNATMRGRELGQYFTPRSVVKLMTELGDLQVSATHVDRVIDPCCGSGGFLIEALETLERKIAAGAFPDEARARLRAQLRDEALFGVDVGREPPIARIARINLDLHGEAGGHVHVAEALDKALVLPGAPAAGFDVVLTNPPFAKEYDPAIAADRALLAAYDLAAGETKQRQRSSALFLERYRDLVKPGGKVLAVLDDSLLGNKRFARVRAFLRAHFIVRAVISLPGDAFARAGARVKTSIVYLTRRRAPDEAQPPVFMWYCSAVGVEDPARQRVGADDALRRARAQAEAAAVLAAFRAGDAAHRVPASHLSDRLDVKSCLLRPGRKTAAWRARGLAVDTVGTWARARAERLAAAPDETVRLLSVRYDGQAEAVPCVRGSIKYGELHVARAGDLVASHINAINGGVCVLPPALDGAAVSPEYSVLTPKPGASALALWAILRSPEVRAELLTRASGLGRHRIDTATLLKLPIPAPAGAVAEAAEARFRAALALEAEAASVRAAAHEEIERALDLRGETAERILLAFKPPR